MRDVPHKKILLYITGLVLVLSLSGWFFIGSNWNKSEVAAISIPLGSTVDTACQAVYRQVKAHGFAGPRIEAQGDFRIEKALLITGQEAKSRYNTNSIFPDDAQLCYVLVRGNIEVGSPFSNKTTIYETGHAIYDAQTLTRWGIGNGTGD